MTHIVLVVAAVLIVSPACARGPQTPPPITEEGIMALSISSPAFEHGRPVPPQFTADGDDVSPELRIDGLSEATASLALIMDDPDAPAGTWDHWVAYDIPPTTTDIPEAVEALGTAGTNSWDDTGYGGPCPPSGIHRYFFAAYAVDKTLGWEPGADKGAVLEAIHDHLLDEATLLGFYTRE